MSKAKKYPVFMEENGKRYKVLTGKEALDLYECGVRGFEEQNIASHTLWSTDCALNMWSKDQIRSAGFYSPMVWEVPDGEVPTYRKWRIRIEVE